VLVQSVGAAARLQPTIDLTGGNDSRLTAAVFNSGRLAPLDRPPRFLVVADDGHPDGVVARQIAQRAGWELTVEPRDMDFDRSLTRYTEAAIASDGAGAVGLEDVRGWLRLRTRHMVVRHHLGSSGGELVRGFFWRHELLNVGRKRVDFARLLRRRLYAGQDVDLAVVDHHLTLQEHDEAILAPFRAIDRQLSDFANPYKLDVIYLARITQKMAAATWGYSGFRTVALPFLTSQVTDISIRVPWHQRVGRRVHLHAIEMLSPELARIRNDAGAPMIPLRLTTFPQHAVYVARDVYTNLLRRRSRTFTKPKTNLPAEWTEAAARSPSRGCLGWREGNLPLIYAHLQLSALAERWPGIQMQLEW